MDGFNFKSDHEETVKRSDLKIDSVISLVTGISGKD